jgi:sec-independent protein translocase protein TatA
MGDLGAGEVLIIVVALVMLFGTKKLPDMARSIGQSLRVFKAETTRMHDDADVVGGAAPHFSAAPALSLEEQARLLEAEAARIRAQAARDTPHTSL